MASSSPGQEVDLIIRFAISVPDLPLTLNVHAATNVLSLKREIRQHLPAEHASNSLRIIHAGKILQDTSYLVTALKLPPPPPGVTPNNVSTNQPLSIVAQGKRPQRDALTSSPTTPKPPPLYLHCSIGAPLSPTELASESAIPSSPTNLQSSQQSIIPTSSTIQARPLGFDRLLTSGFTAADVAALRTQFLALQAARHTPDTMPSAHALRALEDRWLDSTAGSAGSSGGNGAVGGSAGVGLGDEDDIAAGLDDMLLGAVLGFFWPLGALVWGLREEGVWSARRQVAVLAGVVVNFGFGFLWVVN